MIEWFGGLVVWWFACDSYIQVAPVSLPLSPLHFQYGGHTLLWMSVGRMQKSVNTPSVRAHQYTKRAFFHTKEDTKWVLWASTTRYLIYLDKKGLFSFYLDFKSILSSRVITRVSSNNHHGLALFTQFLSVTPSCVKYPALPGSGLRPPHLDALLSYTMWDRAF